MINWNCTKDDVKLIDAVVLRAESICKARGIPFGTRGNCLMDVTACHCNGNPLDLQAMLTAAEFDFMHDMIGICRHIDRTTGKLMDCFVPRLSLRIKETA